MGSKEHPLRSLLCCLCVFLFAAATIALLDSDGARAGGPSPCWTHSLQVVSNLKAAPPKGPLVVLFGGSRARECTVSDQSWTKQLRAQTGMPVVARNLSSSNQTFDETSRLAQHLPRTATLVLIGVDEGRFAKPFSSRAVQLPKAGPISSSYRQHRYDASARLSSARKRALVTDWLSRSYPRFQTNRGANRLALANLIESCQARGLHPVLVTTPWNAAVIKDSFTAARQAWRSDCQGLAADYDVPFLDPSTQVQLANRDFYDLFHVVEPGRSRWQARLSVVTGRSLRDFAVGSGPPQISDFAVDAAVSARRPDGTRERRTITYAVDKLLQTRVTIRRDDGSRARTVSDWRWMLPGTRTVTWDGTTEVKVSQGHKTVVQRVPAPDGQYTVLAEVKDTSGTRVAATDRVTCESDPAIWSSGATFVTKATRNFTIRRGGRAVFGYVAAYAPSAGESAASSRIMLKVRDSTGRSRYTRMWSGVPLNATRYHSIPRCWLARGTYRYFIYGTLPDGTKQQQVGSGTMRIR